MKKILIIIFALFVLSIQDYKANAFALIYTNANYPVTATGVDSPKDLTTLKKGQSRITNIFGICEVGDAGIYKAAKAGHIQKINFIDVNEKAILIFFRRITTTVYGE